jgi:hypothetical protein
MGKQLDPLTTMGTIKSCDAFSSKCLGECRPRSSLVERRWRWRRTVSRRAANGLWPGANGGGWAGGWWYGGAPLYGYRQLYGYYPHYRHYRHRHY